MVHGPAQHAGTLLALVVSGLAFARRTRELHINYTLMSQVGGRN